MNPRTASPDLAEPGRRVSASERTLSRLFRDEVGMGHTAWRNQLRLHLATLMRELEFKRPVPFVAADFASLCRDRS